MAMLNNQRVCIYIEINWKSMDFINNQHVYVDCEYKNEDFTNNLLN